MQKSFEPCVYLDGGRSHHPGLVKVQRNNMGEATGVAVHAGGGVPKGLQNGVDRLPFLHCTHRGERQARKRKLP